MHLGKRSAQKDFDKILTKIAKDCPISFVRNKQKSWVLDRKMRLDKYHVILVENELLWNYKGAEESDEDERYLDIESIKLIHLMTKLSAKLNTIPEYTMKVMDP